MSGRVDIFLNAESMEAYLNEITVVIIGPYEAQQYLDLGDSSHVDQSRVDQYAYDMQRGLWVYPGGIIEVTASGKLKDGHHRLLAVIQSKVPQPMIVVHNVAEHPVRDYDDNVIEQWIKH